MSDYLVQMGRTPVVRDLVKAVGLPTPAALERGKGAYEAQPLAGRTVLFDAAANSYAKDALQAALEAMGAKLAGDASALAEGAKAQALVFDATGVASPEDLKALYRFFHPAVTKLGANGRVLIATGLPERAKTSAQAAAWRALEGFTRSLAKEIGKRGATANLLYVEDGAQDRIEGPARFFLSAHSAYVDGQAVRVTPAVKAGKGGATSSLKSKFALVTGGARGIGAATAKRLAAEGAHVVCLDIPQDEATLQATAQSVGGTPLPLDITDPQAPQKIASFLKEKFGGVDIVVHNAGITRDKTMAKMSEAYWDLVLNINLGAILRIDETLHRERVLRDGGRIVCLSSIGGIAGNLGQTNYGATKAGLIGYVQAEAGKLAERGIAINAVAPGFIETRMTAAMPFLIREAGRRMNSLSQGGQPEDVAELIAFLSTPGAAGVSGNVIRVCGQSLIGA